ncbi:copper resistance protein CopC [Microbacterium sp. NIBRBAC000506063]|uniref:copper resistance protein CopC n=1 Tax=Microbacterium sp. NIBRBAC000506063 TaxID=2734618 RepID=UPI001BB4CD58|nr:copper resistance protein CopC [Microbacterium sp. NIBRBAC000506063]QTV80357.1 copper resistance protein CopC [Microbacterium sp. NIBRBAC000506063]
MLEEAPRAAELLFNEPVRLIDGGIRLFLGDGSDPVILSARTVDTTVTVALPIDLAEGSYALSYRVVSADSHPIAGAISFQIGETVQASPPPDTALEGTPPATETAVSALTILQYLGLLILAGLVFFERIVLRERRPDDRGTRRIMAIAFGAAALASLFLVPASALRITGLPPSAMFDLSSWVPGILWQPVVSAALVTLAGSAGLILALKATSTPGRFAAVAGVGSRSPCLCWSGTRRPSRRPGS